MVLSCFAFAEKKDKKGNIFLRDFDCFLNCKNQVISILQIILTFLNRKINLEMLKIWYKCFLFL
jgi:hypothetical protein